MENPVKVLVFKTNLNMPGDVSRIQPALQQMGAIRRWSVDRDDADKVLRVETTSHSPAHIIDQLNRLGYHCEELTD